MREMVNYAEEYKATVADTVEEAAQVLAGLHPEFSIVEFQSVIFNRCSAKYSEFGNGRRCSREITVEKAREYIFTVLQEVADMGFANGG